MKLLSKAEVSEAMASVPGWAEEAGQLTRGFRFTDFREAMRFVNRVAESAEDEGHHPDIEIRYNRVQLGLTTHDEGGLTELDFRLAARIDALQHAGDGF